MQLQSASTDFWKLPAHPFTQPHTLLLTALLHPKHGSLTLHSLCDICGQLAFFFLCHRNTSHLMLPLLVLSLKCLSDDM